MNKHVSFTRQRRSLPLLMLSLSVGLITTGCTKEIPNVAKTHPVPPGWTTVCLGRHLVDLPPDVQLGGAPPKFSYQTGHIYDFQGFEGSSGRRGVKYGDILVGETHPIPLEWRDDPQNNPSFAWIEGHAKIKRDRIRKSQLADKDKRSARLIAPIETNVPNSYAFNVGGEVEAGFYLPRDQRARLFSIDTFPDAFRSRLHQAQWAHLPDSGFAPGEVTRLMAEEEKLGSHKRAKATVDNIFARYRPRVATDIPMEPGVCTPYGFFTEASGMTEPNYRVTVPLRSTAYPSLLFVLQIETPEPNAPKSIDDVPNPNEILLKDINLAVLAAVSGVKRSFGPDKVQFADQTGRVIGREYHPTETGGGAAYEVEAQVVGEPGSHDKPTITFSMAAALPFVEPKEPERDSDNKIIPWKDPRPLLKGTSPPPLDVGMQVFYQVLGSLRPRAGAAADAN